MISINRDNAEQIAEELGFEYKNTPIWNKTNSGWKERYKNALSAMPIPKAFSEIKICLRQMYKETQEEKYLRDLYSYSVLESFIQEPYSEIAQCPTFEILNKVFKKLKDFPTDWKTIGYEKLKLNKSDIKTMIELWGIPERHTSFHELYIDLYNKTELSLK